MAQRFVSARLPGALLQGELSRRESIPAAAVIARVVTGERELEDYRLQGTSCNRDAIGATITWSYGDVQRSRYKSSGGSYLSAGQRTGRGGSGL